VNQQGRAEMDPKKTMFRAVFIGKTPRIEIIQIDGETKNQVWHRARPFAKKTRYTLISPDLTEIKEFLFSHFEKEKKDLDQKFRAVKRIEAPVKETIEGFQGVVFVLL
jgi:CHAD domain-containing protein